MYKFLSKYNFIKHLFFSIIAIIRDRPFNLKGGLWFFVSFRIFFTDVTRVKILFFFVEPSANFFPEFHIRLYDKISESDYFFFPPPKSEYFFQQHWESEYFFRKKHTPPFKLNGRSLRCKDVLPLCLIINRPCQNNPF